MNIFFRTEQKINMNKFRNQENQTKPANPKKKPGKTKNKLEKPSKNQTDKAR
jgi:hypothetical protein